MALDVTLVAPPVSPSISTIPNPRHDSATPSNETLDYRQRQIMLDYLFTPGPLHRAPVILSASSQHALLLGLTILNQRIPDLIELDMRMHHRYVSLLSDKEYAEVANKHAGFVCDSVPITTLAVLDKKALEGLLARRLALYDKVSKSLKKWKSEIDGRIRRRKCLWEV